MIVFSGDLSKDTELKNKIPDCSGSRKSYSLMRDMSEKSKYRFIADPSDGEMRMMSYTVFAKDISIADCMEGMSSVYRLRWEKEIKTKKVNYILKDSFSNLEHTFEASTPEEKNIFREGRELIKKLEDAPVAIQNSIFRQPVSFSGLPSGMQKSVRYMMEQFAAEEGRAGSLKINSSEINSSKIMINKKKNLGFDRYSLSFSISGGGGSFRFSDFDNFKKEKENKLKSKSDLLFVSIPINLNKQRDVVSFIDSTEINYSANRKRLWEVCQDISAKYDLNIFMDAKDWHTRTASINVQNRSLFEFMTYLQSKYPGIHWEPLPGRMLIIRAPQNPVVTPANGQHDSSG